VYRKIGLAKNTAENYGSSEKSIFRHNLKKSLAALKYEIAREMLNKL
jgi:hypothetical protein